MGATRRKFSREFKVEAVRQLEAGRRLAEVARELGPCDGAASVEGPSGGGCDDRFSREPAPARTRGGIAPTTFVRKRSIRIIVSPSRPTSDV